MRRLKRGDDGIAMVLAVDGHDRSAGLCLLRHGHRSDSSPQCVSAQNSADAAALAAANDCARRQASRREPARCNGADDLLRAPSAEWLLRSHAPLATASIRSSAFMLTTSRRSDRPDGPVGHDLGAAILPITIASASLEGMLDGTTDITLYLDEPWPTERVLVAPGRVRSARTRARTLQCSDRGHADGRTWTASRGDLRRDPVLSPLPSGPVGADVRRDGSCRANHDNGQGPYPILGYADVRLTGYSFNGIANAGSVWHDRLPDSPPGCPCETQKGRAEVLHRGDFIRFLSPGDTTLARTPRLRRAPGSTSPISTSNGQKGPHTS